MVYKALDNLGAYQRWFGFQPNTKLATLIFGFFHGFGLSTKIIDYDISPDGSGRGGPGYTFADEPVRAPYVLGALAMANAGPDTNGSQFFICIDDCQDKLQPLYNLFGNVTSGIEVAQAIQVGDRMRKVTVVDGAG